MRESVLHSAMRLLARAYALEPVGHMPQRSVIDAHGRELRLTGKQNVLRGSIFVDVGVVLVVSIFFGQLIAWAAFAADIGECRFLAHVASEAGRVVAEAGRVADQKALGVLE